MAMLAVREEHWKTSEGRKLKRQMKGQRTPGCSSSLRDLLLLPVQSYRADSPLVD